MAYPVTPSCMPAFNEHRVRFLLDEYTIMLVYAVTMMQDGYHAVKAHALNRYVSNAPASPQPYEDKTSKQNDEHPQQDTYTAISFRFYAHNNLLSISFISAISLFSCAFSSISPLIAAIS